MARCKLFKDGAIDRATLKVNINGLFLFHRREVAFERVGYCAEPHKARMK